MNMGPDATSKELGSPIKAVVVSMLFCFVCCGAAAVAFIAMARYLSAHHAGFWAMMAIASSFWPSPSPQRGSRDG
jgi:hypothetical protein